jgi:glutamyl-tRNA reductase
MTVLAIGLNHHSAPLDVRARFAFTPERLPAALHSLRERLARAAPEATLLSTCNRTELYVAAGDAAVAGAAADLAQPALAWLAEQGGASPAQLADHAYVAEGSAAARHAFRVAAGLDSMVLGEPQILGQIKLAVREAGLAGTLGSTLHQLFQRSFTVAKEVRSATEIGAHSVSMAAAAVRLSL